MRRLILSVCAVQFFLWSGIASAASLVPPSGYLKAAVVNHGNGYVCPSPPPPFTGPLEFPSKYDPTDHAWDKVDSAARAIHKEKTKDIETWKKGVTKLVDSYMQTSDQDKLACAMTWITTWTQAHALENNTANFTGLAARKWALGSVSAAYLHLKFSTSHPLQGYSQQARQIEEWLTRMAERTVVEWRIDNPAHRINNHYYWAAWSVMACSIILDRQDLFDWAIKMYDVFATQVDAEGYLPYELARRTRAFSYHEFAIAPMAMIAAFAQANGVDAKSKGNHALNRMANAIFKGTQNMSVFEAKTGVAQNLEDSASKAKPAWLEAYCSLESCPDFIQEKLRESRPLRNNLLGGDVTAVFAPKP